MYALSLSNGILIYIGLTCWKMNVWINEHKKQMFINDLVLNWFNWRKIHVIYL